MMFYFCFGKAFAMSVEFNKEFGATPLLHKNTCKGETILDIPFGQIIYTPPNVLAVKNGLNGTDTDTNETGTPSIHASSARTAENRQ